MGKLLENRAPEDLMEGIRPRKAIRLELAAVGKATGRPLRGKALTPVVSGQQFWFSWAVFRPKV